MSKRIAFGGILFLSPILRAAEPPVNPVHQDLSFYFDESGGRHPIETIEDWQQRRTQILDNGQVVMDPLPNPDTPVPPQMEVVDLQPEPGYDRKKIRYHTNIPFFSNIKGGRLHTGWPNQNGWVAQRQDGAPSATIKPKSLMTTLAPRWLMSCHQFQLVDGAGATP